jgi:cytochrome c biogenesis factor
MQDNEHPAPRDAWAGRAAWACVGAYVVLIPLTLGSALLLTPVVVLVAVLARSSLRPVAWGAVLGGAGLALLGLAALNSGGPGWVCTSDDLSTQCSELPDTAPWVRAGALLIMAGTLVELVRSRLATRRRSARDGAA